MTQRSAKAQLLPNLLLAALSLALCLGVIEIGLRLFWDGYYLKGEPHIAWHPVRAWGNRPDVSVSYGEPEFVTTMTHNSAGYRNREVAVDPTPGRDRILVLGDSFAYGVGVENNETFSAQLELLDPKLEVINTGVNGYGTNQELLLLRDEGLTLRPDVVLVAFFWNDPANNLHSQVAFKLHDGELVYPEPVPESQQITRTIVRRRWLRHSYAYRFASDRLKVVVYRLKSLLGLPQADGRLDAREHAPAWELQFTLLHEVIRVSRSAGAEVVLVIIPELMQVDPSVRTLGLEEREYAVQERLLEFSAREGIVALDLLPALRAALAEDPEPLYYAQDRHFTARGHRVAANAIHARLIESGVLTR